MHFHRIVARLIVDVDRAGERRCANVVQPPIVGLPTVGARHKHHVTAALVIQVIACQIVAQQLLGHAFGAVKQRSNAVDDRRVALGDEDVS